MGVAESKLSQAPNPCDRVPQEAVSVSPCNLSKKCTAEVELERKLGDNKNGEPSACDGIAETVKINKGSVDGCSDDAVEENDVGVPVLEGDLKFSGDDGIDKENVREPMEKDGHVLHTHEPGSPTEIEVFGNGINLFVEVFGPLDGIPDGENKNVSVKDEGIDNVDGQEFTYDVGDLVWVKTRTPLWWPAMISAPSANAANGATQSPKKGSFLVKYFGNANYIWCEKSNLRPFVEYFEQFSGQNSSRSFFGAVDKAVSVLGHHVKLKMNCPCFKKVELDQNREEGLIPMDRKGKFDVLSLSQFDPSTFSARIRDLACGVYKPNKIELMIIKNSFSAFYRSVGHRELPLQLLNDKDGVSLEAINKARKNSGETQDGDVTISKRKKRRNTKYDADHILGDKMPSSGKGSESRERKKSKYLSFPYVDVNQKAIEEPNVAQETAENINSGKQGSKKPSCKKSDDIDASSGELLAELCCTARDSVYLGKSKYSDSLSRFYNSFRKFAFLDADVASKCLLPHDSKEVEGVTKVKESENKPMEESVEKAVAGNPPKKRAKKKKEKTISAGVESISNSFNTELEGVTKVKESENKPVEESVEKAVADNPPKKRAKKKKEKTISAGLESISDSFNTGTSERVKESVGGDVADKFPKTDNPQEKEKEAIVRDQVKKKKEQVLSACMKSMSSSFNTGTIEPVKESVENDVADKFPKTDNPQEQVKEKEKVDNQAKKKKEQGLSAGMESMPNSFNMGTNSYLKNSAWMISFQQSCSNVLQTETTPENTDSGATLPDLNGNKASFSIDHIHSANQSKPIPEHRNGEFSPPNVDQTAQNIPQLNNGIYNMNSNWSQEFATRQMVTDVMKNGFGPFVQQSFQMGPFLYAGKTEQRKRKRKENTSQVPSAIPDLNGNLSDKTSPEGNPTLSPDENPLKKKRSNKYTTADGETNPGGSLLLTFSEGCTLPTKETLVATFSRFGLLKESETQVLSDSSVQVVYERSSEARFAHRSLEKNNPFGESLVSFKLHCLPDAASKIVKRKNKVQMVQAVVRGDESKNLPANQGGEARDSLHTVQPLGPVDASKNSTAKHMEMRDIGFIRQNVEIMKLALEKAGDNLSPEIRAKLENEIKGFLDKISSMDGGSSSSS